MSQSRSSRRRIWCGFVHGKLWARPVASSPKVGVLLRQLQCHRNGAGHRELEPLCFGLAGAGELDQHGCRSEAVQQRVHPYP